MKPTPVLAVLAAACLSLVAATSHAQGTSKKDALATQLLDQLQLQKMFDTTLDNMPKMMEQQMAGAKMAPEQKAAFTKGMQKAMVSVKQAMSWDTIKPIFVKIYADNFDEADLLGLIAFYKTPVGQKWIQQQPAIQAQTLQAMSTIMPKVQAAMMKSLTEADTAPAAKP